MTFVLTGLDVRDTEIVLVGGGDVTARRAATLHAHGAVLRIIAPQLSARTADFIRSAAEDSDTSSTAPEWVARRIRLTDLDGAWMVHTATGDPEVDTMVADECRARRIWCINASDAAEGSARMPAQARREGTVFGALSTGSPNPSRTAEVVRAVAEQVVQTAHLSTREASAQATPSVPAQVDTLAPAASRATGTVHLLGGGPGPIDLLTVRAHRILASADVIVHDRLGPTDLDDFCDRNTEVINVGKRPGRHPVPQEEINSILVDRAARGLTVARLKGGDPFVFGRGGEEVIACRAAGVPVEVVPGISSAVAAPSCAGIPVTHRGVADAVHVVNGHRKWDARTRAALQDDGTTVVVLMGVSTLADLVNTALADGVPVTRPVAIIENAHRPGRRCVRATLGSVMTAAEVHGVRAPAVIVIGETARAGLLDAVPVTSVPQAVTA